MAEGGLEGRRRRGTQVCYDNQDVFNVDGWLQWQRAGKRVEEDVIPRELCYCYNFDCMFTKVSNDKFWLQWQKIWLPISKYAS